MQSPSNLQLVEPEDPASTDRDGMHVPSLRRGILLVSGCFLLESGSLARKLLTKAGRQSRRCLQTPVDCRALARS